MGRINVAKKAKTASAATGKKEDGSGRAAAVVDPAAKAANLLQMRRARGQVEGILRMIEDDRYCADIIIQITAARASLQAVAKDLLARHLKARSEEHTSEFQSRGLISYAVF